jgi:hypothetical protein
MLKKRAPAKLKHQLVVKAQWPAGVDMPRGVSQVEQTMREVRRQPGDCAVDGVAAARVLRWVDGRPLSWLKDL